MLLEAERQKTAFGYVEDWAVEFLRLSEDDVFATFVQVYAFVYAELELSEIIWSCKLMCILFFGPSLGCTAGFDLPIELLFSVNLNL